MKHFSAILQACRVLAFLFLLVQGLEASAQAPAWQLAVAAGSGGIAEVTATATDASGNLYLAGNFQDSIRIGTTRLVSVGGFDVFIAKWNTATGSFVWAKRAGGADSDNAKVLAVSGANVYVAGSCGNLADFGSTTLTTVVNTRVAFVTRLTDAGPTAAFTWTQGGGGNYNNTANALTVSGTSMYVAGTFGGIMTGLGGTSLTSVGTTDAFVMKLTDTGAGANAVWTQRAGGTNDNAVAGMAVNGSAIYITGTFGGSNATFGTTTLASTSTTNQGNTIFVAKLADAGASAAFSWALRGGGSSRNVASAVAVSGPNVYIAGDFFGPNASFGTIILSSASPGSGYDSFVAKITDTGNTASYGWVQPIGGTQGETAKVLAASSTGIYVGLESSSNPVYFGGIPTALNSNNVILLARIVDAGASSSFAWVQQGGGNSRINALTVQGAKLYIGGEARTPASFGSQTITAATPSILGFFASLTDASGLAAASPSVLNSIGLFPNPAHGTATVQLPAIPGTPTATLTLLDALGRTIRTQTAATNSTAELDLSGLAPGLYAVRVTAGSSTATRRLVVE